MVNEKMRRIFSLLLLFFALAFASMACDRGATAIELNGRQEFEAIGGQEYVLRPAVIPGRKYEVIVRSLDNSHSVGLVSLIALRSLDCEDCRQSIRGELPADGMRITFIAPEDERFSINIYLREGTTQMSIEINEID
jgi:hypothetical protein